MWEQNKLQIHDQLKKYIRSNRAIPINELFFTEIFTRSVSWWSSESIFIMNVQVQLFQVQLLSLWGSQNRSTNFNESCVWNYNQWRSYGQITLQLVFQLLYLFLYIFFFQSAALGRFHIGARWRSSGCKTVKHGGEHFSDSAVWFFFTRRCLLSPTTTEVLVAVDEVCRHFGSLWCSGGFISYVEAVQPRPGIQLVCESN